MKRLDQLGVCQINSRGMLIPGYPRKGEAVIVSRAAATTTHTMEAPKRVLYQGPG